MGLFYFPFTEWSDASDIQLVVKFEEGRKNFHAFLDLADYLENIMGRKVDLLSWDGVVAGLKREIDEQVELVMS